ncbi:B-4DMT family transporter [Amycolatopsis palatopharyngis]|uniref:B-4DMT family transporter n=1 Tax=Amycolatopsis palatopharyngis TaxID=187982 RepID=UPI0014762118|nr:B-4DMT family transporter [Amycolatopsis palatopharyngis]
MPSWLIRGLGMAVLHAVAAVVLAKVTVFRPTEVDLVTVAVVAVLVGAAALWSALDAWLRVPDHARAWFIGALVAGPVAGVLSVIGRSLFVDQTGLSALGGALTGGAAFTALLILIPAGLGMLVGGRLAKPDGDTEGELQDQEPRTTPAG